eukprot:3687767-Prymnesium_polylepis.1
MRSFAANHCSVLDASNHMDYVEAFVLLQIGQREQQNGKDQQQNGKDPLPSLLHGQGLFEREDC